MQGRRVIVKVNLTVAGPPEPKVPSVVGLDQTSAENTLIDAGLTVGKVSSQPDPQPSGTHVVSVRTVCEPRNGTQ